MKEETFSRIKQDLPIIFAATFVSLLASALYNKPPTMLFSEETLMISLFVFTWVIIASAIAYIFLIIIYKLTNR